MENIKSRLKQSLHSFMTLVDPLKAKSGLNHKQTIIKSLFIIHFSIKYQ